MKKNSVILSLQLSRAFSNHVSSRHLSSSQVLREKYQQSQNNGSKSSWNYAFGSLVAATTFAGIFSWNLNWNYNSVHLFSFYVKSQLNFQCTVWKFQDFSITQILRGINFWNSWSVKNYRLPHFRGLQKVQKFIQIKIQSL